ncbi:MAG TPA: hypothetical protein VHW02_13940 [Rhizomicrobium sp.]|jgi:hypothetical protein|nr:hypothetical protein [Rhizomicrobium sp.]
MITKSMRAAATALLLGTSTIAVAGVLTVTTAEAVAVRAAVGKPLQQAIELAKSGNTSAASAKLREAESVSGLTGAEQSAISQTKAYIDAKSGGGAVGSKAKFVADYNAGRYKAAIADADAMRKAGSLDFGSQVIVGQAYYLSGDYPGAIRYLQGLGNSEQVLSLLLSAAYKGGDDNAMRGALEKLVAQTGKPQYWKDLLTTSEHAKGLTDHQTLDLYRIRFLTGTMRNADDYSLLAQLAIELHFPAEAQVVMQQGFDQNILSGDRQTRLINMAKTQAGGEAAKTANAQAAMQAAKSGDDLVQLGENFWGQKRYPEALAAVQAGIAKGVTNKDDAQLRLGMAYLGLNQKDQAAHAFNSVSKTNANEAMVAHLWSLYSHTAPATAAPAPATAPAKKKRH